MGQGYTTRTRSPTRIQSFINRKDGVRQSTPVGMSSILAPIPIHRDPHLNMETKNRKHSLPPTDDQPKKKRLLGRKLSPSQLNSSTPASRLPSRLDNSYALQAFGKENHPPSEPTHDKSPTDTPCSDLTTDAVEKNASGVPVPEDTPSTTIPKVDVDENCNVLRTCSGKRYLTGKKRSQALLSYERLIASRSSTEAGHAQKSFYGIDIHNLIDKASNEPNPPASSRTPPAVPQHCPSIEGSQHGKARSRQRMMWTEKYRARRFIDLVGDERTHRTVLKWLKGWDSVVFPGVTRPKPARRQKDGEELEERAHRKILLLTGAPGLGKTTLAHVCARQAGYEVVEINASDERGRDVVKGRIRDCVGTENVRGVNVKTTDGTVRSAGRPMCVIVDEVDGVVSGSSNAGGEGGFIKALIDLIILDQKNSGHVAASAPGKKSKKGDRFKLLRPMILVCNDVYHPSLKPLRASNLAEVIHIRKPPLDKTVTRMKGVFDKEGIPSDTDGVRRMVEATWGISNRRENRSSSSSAEGDIRSVLVVGEMVASRLRASGPNSARLTRQWVESNLINDLSNGGAAARNLGRGGAKEAVERVFVEGAGFSKPTTAPIDTDSFATTAIPKNTSVTDHNKRHALNLLNELISTSGEPDRIMTDCFSVYPEYPFQDDTFLSKPNTAYEWLNFHDSLSSRVYSEQSWELNPYMGQSVLAFHHLFASSTRKPQPQNGWDGERSLGQNDAEADPMPFSGPRADFAAFEAERVNRALLQQLQGSLSMPLTRMYKCPEELVVELVPYLVRMLTPAVKPIVVGGSGENRGIATVRREEEKEMVRRSAEAMLAVGITFERIRIDDGRGGYVFRMEP